MNVMVIQSRPHSDHGDRRSAGARVKSREPGYAVTAERVLDVVQPGSVVREGLAVSE